MIEVAENIRTAWVCETCGVQGEPSPGKPDACPICMDERQYVGWQGQSWTTTEAIALHREIVFADEHGVITMVLSPGFAINQRAFLIPHTGGNVMWECLATVTEDAVRKIGELGGVTAIAISHPHFYAAMVEWSEALGGVPIHVHAADAEWVQRRSPNVHLWDGEAMDLTDSIRLVRLGSHFSGSAGLLWTRGPRGGGVLFPGDAVQVAMDRRFATFMYSYPNGIPLNPAALAALRDRLEPLVFDDVYGFSTGRQIIGDGKARIEASFDRYFNAIAA